MEGGARVAGDETETMMDTDMHMHTDTTAAGRRGRGPRRAAGGGPDGRTRLPDGTPIDMLHDGGDGPLTAEEIRWMERDDAKVVGSSTGMEERLRLRRNALKRRRLGMPAPAAGHDRMMDVLGWCDPAGDTERARGREGMELADRLSEAAMRCARREGKAIASLMRDPGTLNGNARETVWKCLIRWMDGDGRIPSDPMCRLATEKTAPTLDGKWRQLPVIYYRLEDDEDAIMDDVAWVMALTRMQRLLGGASMPMRGAPPFDRVYDAEAVARAIDMCGDMLYDTGLPDGFTAQSLLAAMGPAAA